MMLKGEKYPQFWDWEYFCSLVGFPYKVDCSQINSQHVGLVSFNPEWWAALSFPFRIFSKDSKVENAGNQPYSGCPFKCFGISHPLLSISSSILASFTLFCVSILTTPVLASLIFEYFLLAYNFVPMIHSLDRPHFLLLTLLVYSSYEECPSCLSSYLLLPLRLYSLAIVGMGQVHKPKHGLMEDLVRVSIFCSRQTFGKSDLNSTLKLAWTSSYRAHLKGKALTKCWE